MLDRLFEKNNRHSIDKPLKVRIVCYEDIDAWILGKFAKRMNERLNSLGIDSVIAKTPDPEADINHHIIYLNYDGKKLTNETMMITHVDSNQKVQLIKKQLNNVRMGICMSKETVDKLVSYGLPRHKLCYVDPAQDNVIKPRKYVIGLTSNLHDDYRKREEFLVDLCSRIDSEYFKFVIMGTGWNKIIDDINKIGIETEYYDHFDYNEYVQLMPKFDYYLYFGFDEGSMGYMDALRAGIGTIVTPQGYHMDFRDGIDYPCSNIGDFVDAFNSICSKRKKRVNLITDYTWETYTDKHIEIWNYLLKRIPLGECLKNRGLYNDGIFSVLVDDIYG